MNLKTCTKTKLQKLKFHFGGSASGRVKLGYTTKTPEWAISGVNLGLQTGCQLGCNSDAPFPRLIRGRRLLVLLLLGKNRLVYDVEHAYLSFIFNFYQYYFILLATPSNSKYCLQCRIPSRERSVRLLLVLFPINQHDSTAASQGKQLQDHQRTVLVVQNDCC
jgi:hypothetical protein